MERAPHLSMSSLFGHLNLRRSFEQTIQPLWGLSFSSQPNNEPDYDPEMKGTGVVPAPPVCSGGATLKWNRPCFTTFSLFLSLWSFNSDWRPSYSFTLLRGAVCQFKKWIKSLNLMAWVQHSDNESHAHLHTDEDSWNVFSQCNAARWFCFPAWTVGWLTRCFGTFTQHDTANSITSSCYRQQIVCVSVLQHLYVFV